MFSGWSDAQPLTNRQMAYTEALVGSHTGGTESCMRQQDISPLPPEPSV